jgi:hypothetical protein
VHDSASAADAPRRYATSGSLKEKLPTLENPTYVSEISADDHLKSGKMSPTQP